MPIHPKIDDESGLAYGTWKEEWRDVSCYEGRYQVNHQAEVRNKQTGQFLKPHLDRVKLYNGKGGYCFKPVYHLVLEAFFPHIPRNGRTVDHFDENHKNNYIANLWWLTPSQQSIKSNRLKPRNSVPAHSKAIEQWSMENPSIKLCTFSSAMEAERQTGISSRNISKCATGKRHGAGGFHWRFQAQTLDLTGEEWKTSEALIAALQERNPKMKPDNLSLVRVSNLGRIRTALGIISKGAIQQDRSGYRVYGRWLVHQLVWLVWGDGRKVPRAGDALVIMHSDELEKDEDGCVSNAIAHLRLGTPSENTVSYYRAKAQKRLFSQRSGSDGQQQTFIPHDEQGQAQPNLDAPNALLHSPSVNC